MRRPSRSLRDLLLRTEILRELPPAAADAIADSASLIRAARGRVIFTPGQDPSVYALLQGRVGIVMRPTVGVEVQVAVCHRGSLLGETSPFLGTHAEEARALESTLLARLDAAAFVRALEEHRPAGEALRRAFASRISYAQQRIGEVSVHSAKQRLLFLFDHLGRREVGGVPRGDVMLDRISQAELADMVGTSRVAVSRALRDLAEAGVISISSRRIIVLRRPGDEG